MPLTNTLVSVKALSLTLQLEFQEQSRGLHSPLALHSTGPSREPTGNTRSPHLAYRSHLFDSRITQILLQIINIEHVANFISATSAELTSSVQSSSMLPNTETRSERSINEDSKIILVSPRRTQSGRLLVYFMSKINYCYYVLTMELLHFREWQLCPIIRSHSCPSL